MKSLVAILMDSQHDWEWIQHSELTLNALGVPNEVKIISAHRSPELVKDYALSAESRGLEVIIAGAKEAAHLPGLIASYTILPVLGVPLPSEALKGIDSLLSILQMPAGIPVGTLAIGRSGAINAALLAVHILGLKYPRIQEALIEYRAGLTKKIKDHSDPRV